MVRMGTSRVEGEAFRAKAWSSVSNFLSALERSFSESLVLPGPLELFLPPREGISGSSKKAVLFSQAITHWLQISPVSSTWCPFSSTSVAPSSTTSPWHQQVGLWLRTAVLSGRGHPWTTLGSVSATPCESTFSGSLFVPSFLSRRGTVDWLWVCYQTLGLVWSLAVLSNHLGRKVYFALPRASFDTRFHCLLPTSPWANHLVEPWFYTVGFIALRGLNSVWEASSRVPGAHCRSSINVNLLTLLLTALYCIICCASFTHFI